MMRHNAKKGQLRTSSVRLKNSSLTECTLREAGVHGIYFGFTDAAFSTLLALASATPLLFGILTHGGGAATIAAQYFGLQRTRVTKNPQRDLSFYCAFQAAMLFLLVAVFTCIASPQAGFATLVCIVSLLSLFTGNLASPTWHACWAESFVGSNRLSVVNRRSLVMNGATFAAVLIGAALFSIFTAKIALILLLTIAGIGKLYSAMTLYFAAPFATVRTTEAQERPPLGDQPIAPLISTFITFYFGLGISIALVIPYLTHFLGFSASQIFSLGIMHITGQLVLSTLVSRNANFSTSKNLLLGAFLIFALLPLCWCVTSSVYTWYFLFFCSGLASGVTSLALQHIVQSPRHPKNVASTLSQLVTATTISQIIGGFCGGLVLTSLRFSYADQQCYFALFLISALIRGIALILPKTISSTAPQDLPLENELTADIAKAA